MALVTALGSVPGKQMLVCHGGTIFLAASLILAQRAAMSTPCCNPTWVHNINPAWARPNVNVKKSGNVTIVSRIVEPRVSSRICFSFIERAPSQTQQEDKSHSKRAQSA